MPQQLPQNYGLWWIRFLGSFWQVALPVCRVLQPEWYFPQGVGCTKIWGFPKVWDPVTLIIEIFIVAYWYW